MLAFAVPMAALAQTLDKQTLLELDDDESDILYQRRTVEQIEDMDVVGSGGERIGEIEEVLANTDNEIVAVVVEYDEGFLDLGEREVVMPIDRLQFGEDGSRVATTLSEDDLRSLEVWDD
jgi:hypothetical protein